MDAEKRQDLSDGWKWGVMRATRPGFAKDRWLALIDGKCERDVLDINAAALYGFHGDTFGDFMAQRFPECVKGVQA
jgi:hypothetical protein